MASTELVPYTATERDAVETLLAEEANKQEIHYEQRDSMQIIVYYLRRLGGVSMSLTIGRDVREFPIPTDKVSDAIEHPEYYANEAGLYRPIIKGEE